MLSRNKTCSLLEWMKEALLCLCVLYILTQGKNWIKFTPKKTRHMCCTVHTSGHLPFLIHIGPLGNFQAHLIPFKCWIDMKFHFFHILGSLHTEERSRLVSMLEVRLCYGIVHFILSINRELQIPASPYVAQKQPQHVLPLFQTIFGTSKRSWAYWGWDLGITDDVRNTDRITTCSWVNVLNFSLYNSQCLSLFIRLLRLFCFQVAFKECSTGSM